MRKREAGRKHAKKRDSMWKPALFVGVMAAALAGVVFVPLPDAKLQSGIELYGEENSGEKYGPDLPQSTVGSYPVPIVESVVLPEEEDTEEKIYVYASDDQECYHMPTCKFAFGSGHKFTVYEANLLGYKPCGRCEPPTLADLEAAEAAAEETAQ